MFVTKEQREMILNYEQRVSQLEEENRLLKIKIKQYEEVLQQGGGASP
jgi:hypothetical protein